MTLPDHTLERYRLGELSEPEKRWVESELTDADHARLAELRGSDQEILERYPPRVMAIAINQRMQARRRAWVMPAVGSAVVLLGATAAVTVALTGGPTLTQATNGGGSTLVDHGVRAKGDSRVLVYVENDTSTPLEEAQVVAHGETVQLALNPGQAGYAMLVSVDGRGVVTAHLPVDSGVGAVPVEPGRTMALPQAYTLDDAPFERFFLVTSNTPFESDAVLDAARTVAGSAEPGEAPLDVPETLHVDEHLLRKVSQ